MIKKENTKTIIIMLAPTLISIIFLTYYPLCRSAIISLQQYSFYKIYDIHFIGFKNYLSVFFDTHYDFVKILINTFYWVVVSLFFQFVLGFILALLMKEPFKGRGIYSGLVFYPWAISGFAVGLIWAWMFNGQFGVINDLLQRMGIIKQSIGFLSEIKYSLFSAIVANIWYGIPFFAIMLLAALQSIPLELYEAAEIDGAGYFSKLFKITIPYIKPTIINTVLIRTLWIMNYPQIIYGMTGGGPANSSNILAVHMINKITKTMNFGEGAAIGIIIIAILFTYILIYLTLTRGKDLTF